MIPTPKEVTYEPKHQIHSDDRACDRHTCGTLLGFHDLYHSRPEIRTTRPTARRGDVPPRHGNTVKEKANEKIN